MSFVHYYTRIIVQIIIFTFTKLFILRGVSAAPRVTFTPGSHIIAANHRSGLDPFVIVSSLRFRDFFRLAPFSFMTANAFMRPLWLRPLAWAAGCFPAHPGLGAYGIDKAISSLADGYTLVIFPEGKRTKSAPLQAKRGIEVILQRSPQTRLIMAHIEWHAAVTVRSIRLSYPPVQVTPKTSGTIMDTIYAL